MNPRILTALSILAISTFWASTASACPGCQNPNLPMARSTGVYLGEGSLRLGLNLSATAIEVSHESGCRDLDNCTAVPVQELHFHEQFLAPIQLSASLEWGISDDFALEASLPVRLVISTVDYSLPDGSDFTPLDVGLHHRNETLAGPGDPTIAVRGAVFLEGWWLIGRVGTSLPLGRIEPDPFEAGDNLEEHQHIQFGTGTFDPIFGGEVARSFGRFQIAGYGVLQLPVTTNKHGFQAGSRALVGVQGGWRAGDRFVIQTSLEGFREGPERWGGVIQQDGLLGRQELLLGAQAVFSFGGPQYSAGLRVPLLREIFLGDEQEEGDITSPVSINLGIQWSLL